MTPDDKNAAPQDAKALAAEVNLPAESASHTDHPLRHWDRTCPACNKEAMPQDSPPTPSAPTVHVDYSIALARAIEHHCRGVLVPSDIAEQCPFHAAKLNEFLTTKAAEIGKLTASPCVGERRYEDVIEPGYDEELFNLCRNDDYAGIHAVIEKRLRERGG